MKSYFQLNENIIHLNHAAVAPWPIITRDTVIAFAKENANIGSQNYLLWMQTEQQLKHKLMKLINAKSTEEIAILKNTSEGLSVIAQGLHFKPGDNIVIPTEEFPSNKVVWQSLSKQGVEVRSVSIDGIQQPEQALINAIDNRTQLLSCSSVQYARGLRLNLKIIGEACVKNKTLFCIDAIQSLGAVPFDCQQYHADFVVADGHKWMCGPEGTALFYCRKPVQDKLELRQYGWHMLKDPFSFSHSPINESSNHDLGKHNSDQQHITNINIADNAQRFESGSPNMMGIAALNASLGVLLEIGIETIQQKIIDNVKYLASQLQAQNNISILSSLEDNRFAGILTFKKHAVDNEHLYQYLQTNNIICAYRGGGVRFSPHFYTEKSQLDIAIKAVAEFT